MKIEVWSDFVCPFCYIGKRTFEAALEEFPHHESVFVEYKSYELDSGKKMNANVGEQAAGVGLIYNFENMQPTNTFDAHRLAKYAASHNKGNEMTERLLKAYFIDSDLISDFPTLIRLASEVGLNAVEVEAFLQSCKHTKVVRLDQEQAEEIGVQDVPFFVFNEKYAVSGAQPAEVFTEVLEKLWEEENEQPDLQTLNPQKNKTTYCCDGEEGCKE